MAYEFCTCPALKPRYNELTKSSLSDTPETFKDAPVAVQLVGRTGEDEVVVAMVDILDEALKELK